MTLFSSNDSVFLLQDQVCGRWTRKEKIRDTGVESNGQDIVCSRCKNRFQNMGRRRLVDQINSVFCFWISFLFLGN